MVYPSMFLRFVVFFLPLIFSVSSLLWAGTDPIVDTASTSEVFIIKGELENLSVSNLTRVSLTNPDIADIVDVNDKEILIIGKEIGQTVLFIWDEHGKRPITIRVFSQNLEMVQDRLNNLLKTIGVTEVTIDINRDEGRLIVVGDVPEDKKTAFDQVIAPFSDSMLNLSTSEKNKDLIQIDMQVTELGTTLFKALGIDWTAGSGSGFSFGYPETLPTFDGSVGDYFKIGDFQRTTSLVATVNALVREGKGKVLSQPKLVVISGEQASLQVGGAIPVRTTTSSSTGTQENISFKDYGVGMSITPEIMKGKIDITVSVDISDIDSANAVGQDVAFVTRSAQTKLYLDDHQTVVLAGLIKANRGTVVRRVPYVSKVPILGMLFRGKTMPSADTDTEVVISLTPHILTDHRAEAAAKKKASGEEELVVAETASDQAKQAIRRTIPQKGMAEYMKTIQQKLTQSIQYPEEAVNYGWEGTAKLNLLILQDGTLALATVKETSGYDIFDQDAVETAKRLSPYDQFPSDVNLQELEVTIPIVYSLHK